MRLSSLHLSFDRRPDAEHEVGRTCGPQHGVLVNINYKAWSLLPNLLELYRRKVLCLHSVTLNFALFKETNWLKKSLHHFFFLNDIFDIKRIYPSISFLFSS